MGPRGDSKREMLVLEKGGEYLNCMSAVRKGRNIGNWHVRQLCASSWMQHFMEKHKTPHKQRGRESRNRIGRLLGHEQRS